MHALMRLTTYTHTQKALSPSHLIPAHTHIHKSDNKHKQRHTGALSVAVISSAMRESKRERERYASANARIHTQVRSQSQSLHLLFGQWHKDYFINKSKEEAELENYFLA